MISMNLHHVSALTIESHNVENSNALTLRIKHGDAHTSVTLFGLPAEVTSRLVDALGPIVTYSEWAKQHYGIAERQGQRPLPGSGGRVGAGGAGAGSNLLALRE